MARPRKPQTTEETLKYIELQLRKNEEEHASLLEEKKKILAQIELEDFNDLRSLLSAQGMSVRDLINKMSPSAPPTPEPHESVMSQ